MEMANNIIKMKKTAFILLLAACTTLSAWAAKKKAVVASVLQLPEQEVAYNDGIAFLKMGNYEDAATKFSAAIAIDSTFAKAYYNRAVAQFNLENYNKAMSDVDNAIRLQGDKPDTNCHVLKAKIYYGLVNISAAVEEINKALENDPNNFDAMLDKAAILESTGKFTDAIEVFNQINFTKGGNALTFNELGNCYMAIGEDSKAFDCYTQSYKADSTNAITKFNYATALWKINKDTVNSIRLIDQLIEKDVTNAEYYSAKAFILSQAGKTDESIANFDTAIANNKNLASAYLGKGITYYNLGKIEDAVNEYSKAIDANTNYGDAYLNRAIAEEDLKQFNKACDDLEKAAELGTKNAQEYYTKQCK